MTRNTWGKGEVSYVGFMPSDAMIQKIVAGEVERAGVEPTIAGVQFPLIVRGGTLRNGHLVRYIFNYSATPQQLTVARAGTELLHERKVASGQKIALAAWDLAIVE